MTKTDLMFALRRALYDYNKTPIGPHYDAVVAALGECVDGGVNLWMLVETDGDMAKPGMVTDSEGVHHYILAVEEWDLGERDNENLTRMKVNTRALIQRVAQDASVGGICLNPWDGGCFISREDVSGMLEM